VCARQPCYRILGYPGRRPMALRPTLSSGLPFSGHLWCMWHPMWCAAQRYPSHVQRAPTVGGPTARIFPDPGVERVFIHAQVTSRRRDRLLRLDRQFHRTFLKFSRIFSRRGLTHRTHLVCCVVSVSPCVRESIATSLCPPCMRRTRWQWERRREYPWTDGRWERQPSGLSWSEAVRHSPVLRRSCVCLATLLPDPGRPRM
jgi:hypothetical protein